MTGILNLEILGVIVTEQNPDQYHIYAEGLIKPTVCRVCESGLYWFGRVRQFHMDTPKHGKPVLIKIDRQRFRCKSCLKTLSESLPDIDCKRLATSHQIRYIEERCLKVTFLSLAREIGIDVKTVRVKFDNMVHRLESQVQFERPAVLGIDEIHILDEYRAVLTNIEKLSMFDMRLTRKKVDLPDYF